jgi:hypothetical protein
MSWAVAILRQSKAGEPASALPCEIATFEEIAADCCSADFALVSVALLKGRTLISERYRYSLTCIPVRDSRRLPCSAA